MHNFASFSKSAPGSPEWYKGRHRFEHWYRDNTVYFITARCRDRYLAFESEDAKSIFWDRYEHYARMHGFTPWVTSLMGNHCHILGYLRVGTELKEMMRKIHGSVAKLVNDRLPARVVPFWVDTKHKDYFDGCIRDELQARRAYRYTLTQCRRHHVCSDPADYPHTRVRVELERAIRRANELDTWLADVPYRRYQRERRGR